MIPIQHTNHNRFLLKPMKIIDLPDVLTIEEQVQSHPWTAGIFEDCIRVGYLCWVCKENATEVVGYLIQSIAIEEMHLLNVCIHPDKQRMSLGTLLVQHSEQVARQANAKKAFLEVRPHNIAAIHLYKKLGYLQIGVRRDYYKSKDGREDAIVMSKQLITKK